MNFDYIEVPKKFMDANKEVKLTADIMFVNGMVFFVTLSINIRYFTSQQLNNRYKSTLISALLRVIAVYHKIGFIVIMCYMDGQFECMREDLLQQIFGVELNTCGPDEHVPEIERGIRIIKERVRATLLILLFKTIPISMVVHSVLFTFMWLNFSHQKEECQNFYHQKQS